MTGGPLADMGILVTRPRDLAAGLMQGIAQLGGIPVAFPAVDIAPPADAVTLRARIDALPDYRLAIFISPTAVAQALPAILQRHGAWPAATRIAAVGLGTARTLERLGVGPVLCAADGADSEHLLALPELADVAGARVLILRGEGGRDLLAQTLSQRGARVDHAECYRRLPPGADPVPLLARWRAGGIQAVTVTSAELLDNLFLALGHEGAALLRATPLFAPHPRIAEAARVRGVATAIATEPGDAGLLAGLAEWFTHD